jgi:hypothetical protein
MLYLGPNYPKIGGPIDISHFLSPLKLTSFIKCWSSGPQQQKKTSKNFLSKIIRENFDIFFFADEKIEAFLNV